MKVGHPSLKKDRKRKVLLSDATDRDLERLVGELTLQLGIRIPVSALLRSLIEISLLSKKQVLEEAKKSGEWDRPSFADAKAIDEQDKRVSKLLMRAIKRAPAIK